MHAASFRFYSELNDFLPREFRHISFQHSFSGSPSIKDTIEAIGVPHTEVDLIIVNEVSVDFDYQVKEGDVVSVYPVFESFDITPLVRLRPEPLRKPCFILDTHLGRLARYLRLLGFDSLYRNDYEDDRIENISSREDRIVLTRDRGLLKRSQVVRGYCVRASDPEEQLIEVARRFDLLTLFKPFTRCIECNGKIQKTEKADLREEIPAYTHEAFDEFGQCEKCSQVYWKGSHYERLQELVERMRTALEGSVSQS